MRGQSCFNGAATLSLRKLHCHDVVWKNSDSFNGAATLSLRKPGKSYGACLARKVASMGPQLYRCGNFIAMMLSGKIAIASMGPQLYRCGNLARVTAPAWPERLLQWGRNFIVAETKKGGGIPYLIFYASMGPQLYRCGNMAIPMVFGLMGKASMGPQLYRCGNASRTQLQWINFIVAEPLC